MSRLVPMSRKPSDDFIRFSRKMHTITLLMLSLCWIMLTVIVIMIAVML